MARNLASCSDHSDQSTGWLSRHDILTRFVRHDIVTDGPRYDILTGAGSLLRSEEADDVMAEAWAAVRTPEDLGRFLAGVREDHGLTQEALAEELGVSRRYVSEIENGKPGLYTERLFQMLRLLGVRLRAEQIG